MKEAKTSYNVVAHVDQTQPLWRSVLSTTDEAYAKETVRQFEEAKVPVRLDILVPSARKGKRL